MLYMGEEGVGPLAVIGKLARNPVLALNFRILD